MRYDWNWREAEKEFKKAITLNPNYASAHHWYALYLAMVGRFSEARAEMSRAGSLDPLSLIIGANTGWVYYFAREYEPAINACRRALVVDSGFSSAHIKLGWAYEQVGRYDEAIREFQEALDLVGDDPPLLSILAHALALAGRREEALAILTRVTNDSSAAFVSSYHIAVLWCALDNRQEALAWLERAYNERSGWLCWLKVDPKLDDLRGDPAFVDLLRRVGLQE
jgi:Flp pilus assembly protein TadD